MKTIKFIRKSIFFCVGLFFGLIKSSYVYGEEILIDPFWVLSTSQQILNNITFEESNYKIDYCKNLGPMRLLHLASPCLHIKPTQRAYNLESSESLPLIIYLTGQPASRTLSLCTDGYLIDDDSQAIGTAYYSCSNEHALVGLKTSQNKVELVPNDLINSLIIREVTAKNTTLEDLPWELILLMMTYQGTAKALRPVSKEFAALATSIELPIQDVLNSRKDLKNYLENDKTRAYQLPKVKIGFAGFDNEDLERLVAANPNITQLDLSNCKMITDSALAHLAKLPKLTFLDLSNCSSLTELGIEHLKGFNDLTYIDYKWTDITDKKTLDAYIDELKNNTIRPRRIQCVRLSSNAGDHELTELVEANPNLTHLALGECKNITNFGLSNLQKLTKLTHLDLSKYKEITEFDLECIGTLTSLTSLDLSRNEHLRDVSLEWLKNLTNLTHLYLNQCEQLTGLGFSHLKNLTKLTTLELNACSIDDTGVKQLSCFSNLTHLGLCGIVIASSMTCRTEITEAGLAYLAGLTNLTHLSLGGESITDHDLQNLACLRKLGQLDLTGCTQFTGSGFEYLEDSPDLTSLNLAWCGLTEAGIIHLVDLTHIKHLLLAECSGLNDSSLEYMKSLINLTNLHLLLTFLPGITDSGLKHLAGIPKLTTLSIVGCDTFTGSCFQHFSSLAPLAHLHVVSCKGFTDDGLTHVSNLTKLVELDLEKSVKLTGFGVEHLKNLTNLNRLNLSDCRNIAEDALSSLVALSHLQTLGLPRGEKLEKDAVKEYLEKISGTKKERLIEFLSRQNISIDELPTSVVTASLSELSTLMPQRDNIRNLKLSRDSNDDIFTYLQYFPNLTSLDISECRNITDTGIERLAKIPLTKLYLKGCEKVTDAGIAYLKDMPLTLLSPCINITDTGLKFLENMPLMELNLNGCHQVTDAGIPFLPKDLTTVSLQGCYQVTDTGLQHLLENLPTLTVLNISQCREITGAALQRLQSIPLTGLYLGWWNNITDVDLGYLPKSLVDLSLYMCPGITSAGIEHIINNFNNLTNIWLPYGKKLEGNIQEEYQKEVNQSKEKLGALLESRNMKFDDLSTKVIAVSTTDLHLLLPHGRDIRKLKISSCGRDAMELLKLFPNLTELHIDKSTFFEINYPLKNLTYLYLSQCPYVQDAELRLILKSSSYLTRITLHGCRSITDKSMGKIAKHCTGLTELNLHGCTSITDEGIIGIASNCPALTNINLGECPNITGACIMCVARYCPDLTKVNLSNTKVTNTAFNALAKSCPRLTTLKVNKCSQLTDKGIKEAIKHCTGLNKLNLGGTKVTGSGFGTALENCQQLTKLNLSECREITDEGIIEIARCCPNLANLNIGSNKSITDGGLKYLPTLKNLMVLSLDQCSLITNGSIGEIAKRCTNLRKLNLSGCTQIADAGVLHLDNLPSLQTLTLPDSLKLEGKKLREYLNTLVKKWLVTFLYDQCISPEDLSYLPNKTFNASPDGLATLSHYRCQINDSEVTGLDLGEDIEVYQRMLEELREYKNQELRTHLDPLLQMHSNDQDIHFEDLSNRTMMVSPSGLSLLSH